MRAWMWRLGLSLILTLGLQATRVFAQPPSPGAPLVPLGFPPDVSPPAPIDVVFARPQPERPQHPHRLKNALLDRGYCCDAQLHWFGCGSWKTQLEFMFGSCRVFFVEPCLNPPLRTGPRIP